MYLLSFNNSDEQTNDKFMPMPMTTMMIFTVRQQLAFIKLVLFCLTCFWSSSCCYGFSSSPLPNPDNKSISAGPKSSGGGGGIGRTRRPPPSRRSPGGGGGDSGGPKGDSRYRERRERRRQQQQQSDNQQQNVTVKFDGKAICSQQHPNLDAPPLDLERILSSSAPTASASTQSSDTSTTTTLRCVSGKTLTYGSIPLGEKDDDADTPASSSSPYFESLSLDDLEFERLPKINFRLEGFSEKFNSDVDFRTDLRSAIRQDIFDTTPFYQNLPAKAASILLLPDSSLEGSWKVPLPTPKYDDVHGQDIRMKHTTKVLHDAFSSMSSSGEDDPLIPTGDELFQAIGRLCSNDNGSESSSSTSSDAGTGGASTHFIDIYGRQDRTINHSWHMDAGRAGFLPDQQVCRTVIWGFPAPDEINFRGCGVFSHIVKLKHSCSLQDLQHLGEGAVPSATLMEPVLFDGVIDEKYIVRPPYQPGKEILMYRDVDVVHSAPDCTYRSSIMRFM